MTASTNKKMSWADGTGGHGIWCQRILRQQEAGRRDALLPLVVLENEELPRAGERAVILTAPTRGVPYEIICVEVLHLHDLTDDHYASVGLSRDAFATRWDDCNERHPFASNPEVMLLHLKYDHGWFREQ